MSAKSAKETKARPSPGKGEAAARGPGDPGPAGMLEMFYYLCLARAVDERMWALQRSGKAAFVISGQGHEGAQVGAGYALDRELDWLVPFYRSVAAVLMKGMPPAEGASNVGDFHEALNFAGVHRLPVVFVVENNGYAISVPVSKQMAVPTVSSRAAGYGMPGVTVDGSHVLQVYEEAREAVARARRGEGPTLMEVNVPRLTAHSSDDQQEKYRPSEELAHLRERDPVRVFAAELRERGVLTPAKEQEIRARITREVDEGTEIAEAAPLPDPATATRYVYAEPPDAGR